MLKPLSLVCARYLASFPLSFYGWRSQSFFVFSCISRNSSCPLYSTSWLYYSTIKMPPKKIKKVEDENEHSLSESGSDSEADVKPSKSKKTEADKPAKGKARAARELPKKKIEEENKYSVSESGSDSEADVKPSKNKKKEGKTPAKGRKRGAKAEAAGDEAPKKKAKVELVKPELKDLNFDCESKTPNGEEWTLKISTWNVAGLRAWVKKDGIAYIKKEDPDIICLQETKCPEAKVPPEAKLPGYYTYWANSVKDGYAGVAVYSKKKPISVKIGLGKKEHDIEGRLITAEYEKFYLVTTYVPNAGQGLKTLPKRLQWDVDFLDYLKELDAKKPVILCGDLNVAHNAIDLANPATNTKHAGFTQEERDGFTKLLKEGFVDSFRHLYPDKTGAYTFWAFFGNARARNTGWRLDYFVLSERLLPQLCDNVIRNQVFGSDHCPVTLFLNI